MARPSSLGLTPEGKQSAIAELAMSLGWQALAEHIAVKIDSATMQLTGGTKLSIEEVRLLQGEIRAHNELMSYVNTCVNKTKAKGE